MLIDLVETKGKNATMLLHQRIDVYKNERRVFHLDESLTKPPDGGVFKVRSSNDYDKSVFIVSLNVDPAKLKRRGIKRKSISDDGKVIEETYYGKKRKEINLFLYPEKIPEYLLKNLTGLGRGQFGQYCKVILKITPFR